MSYCAHHIDEKQTSTDRCGAYVRHRVIIAGIRNLGACPCPRCLVKLDSVHLLGTTHDRSVRISLARDEKARRELVATARNLIYHDQYAVNSARVEALLAPQSLVPTKVSCMLSGHSRLPIVVILECILENFADRSRLQYIRCPRPGSLARI